MTLHILSQTPNMATTSLPDQSGPTGTPSCSDGIPSREGTPTPAPFDPKFLKYQTPTDKAETPKDRPRYLRQKIVAIIGYAACLFTGMIPVFYMLECMHIVPRSLHKTHELVVRDDDSALWIPTDLVLVLLLS